MTTLIERIRHSVIGSRTPISTPFGEKPLIYADYTKGIEVYITVGPEF